MTQSSSCLDQQGDRLGAGRLAAMIRRLTQWLVKTPLHPQWLVLRSGEYQKKMLVAQISGRMLDVGCGNRPLCRWLPPSVEYIGLDYPATAGMGYTGRPEVFGDAQRLPFGNDLFDSIAALDVMEHLPAPERCMAEMARVLKPGGQIIIQTPFLYPLHDMPYDYQRWTQTGLEELVVRHGLHVTSRKFHGTPTETAAALMAIALAKGIWESVRGRHFALFLSPLLIAFIPLVNLAGWLLGRLLPEDDFMPLGYTLICRKTG